LGVIGETAPRGDYGRIGSHESLARLDFPLREKLGSSLVVELSGGFSAVALNDRVGIEENPFESLREEGSDGAFPRVFHADDYDVLLLSHGATIPEKQLVLKGNHRYSNCMTIVLVVLFSLLPLSLCFVALARARVGSRRRMLLATVFGLAALAVASVAQVLLDPVTKTITGFPGILFSSFVEAAAIEELSKLIFVLLLCSIRPSDGRTLTAREILSGALLLGLSFSGFETLSYALRNPSVLWLRAITALPVHVSVSLMAGALAASFMVGSPEVTGSGALPARRGPARAFAVAVALHGAYDAGLSLSGAFISLSAVAICVLAVMALGAWKKPGNE